MNNFHEFLDNLSSYLAALLLCKPAVFIFAAVMAVLGGWWRGSPEMLKSLIIAAPCLFTLDFITGLARSVWIDHHRFSSAGMGQSMIKLFVYLSLFILCIIFDSALSTGYSAQLAVLTFIIAREAKSNLENITALKPVSGVEVPKCVSDSVDKLNDINKQSEKCEITNEVKHE